MITCKFRGGRLGEITYMLYGLFYFCIKNNIPLDQIVVDKNYVGSPFFSASKTHVIKENFEFFENIKNIFRTDFNNIFKNGIPIPAHFCQMYSTEIFQYEPEKNYILENYWQFPINLKLFRALFKNQNLIGKLKRKYNDIDFTYACSIHIRRGDVVQMQNYMQNTF